MGRFIASAVEDAEAQCDMLERQCTVTGRDRGPAVLFHVMRPLVMTIFMLDYLSCFLHLAFLLLMAQAWSSRSVRR